MDQFELRQKLVTSARRVVIKIGSGVLTGKDGLNGRRIGSLVAQISALKADGFEIVMVSSGAIASGFRKMGLKEKPKTVRQQQACAAIGQAGLMMVYEKAFARHGYKAAQILLTSEDLAHRRRYLNARNTLATLLEWNVVPIINENDTVAVAELKYGDNDTVAGLVTMMVEADLFINLTDINGLYDRDPRRDRAAAFLPVVEAVGAKVEAMAGRIPGALGAGGMYTKIVAARKLARQGVPSLIANGGKRDILLRILKGEFEGTLFLPKKKMLQSRKHWIAFTTKPKGVIVIDPGARRAVLNKGKSLLPSGILEFTGQFNLGDAVRVMDEQNELVAVGLTNYTSDELLRIRGHHSSDIQNILGYKHSDEVIHRDNMVVGDDLKV